MRKITKLTRSQIASFAITDVNESALNQRIIKYFEGIQNTVGETPSAIDSTNIAVDNVRNIAIQAMAIAKAANKMRFSPILQRVKNE
jgi:hypothetical protein